MGSNRARVFAAAIMCGIIAGILALFWVNRQPEVSHPVIVAAAAQDITAGTIIEPGMVKHTAISSPPPSSMLDESQVIGKVAIRPISEGQLFLVDNVQSKSSTLGLAYAIPAGKRAVTVALDPIIGVAGFLKPGDHVDVLATFVSSINTSAVTKTVLQDQLLLATGSRAIQTENNPQGGKPVEVPNATLAVSPLDGEKLVLAESRGKLRLALRGVGDTVITMVPTVNSRTLVGLPVDVPVTVATERPQRVQTVSQMAPSRMPVSTIPFGMRTIYPPMPPPQPTNAVDVIRGTGLEKVPVKT